MTRIRVGTQLHPQQTTYAEFAEAVRRAEDIGVDTIWNWDHFFPLYGEKDGPHFEGWTLLTAMAMLTTRAEIGCLVTCNSYRNPNLLADMARTVDHISGGRLILGIGAGWNEYEHASMGIPLYPPGERIRRLGEACEIIKRLFTQHLTDFDGRYYQLKDARCEPKPVQKPYPPFVIGGGGEQLTLRVTAQYADVWNFAGGPPETFQHKVKVLHEHCATIGRDPSEIELSIQSQVNYDNLAETAATVQSFVDVGATHLILNLRHPYPAGIVARLADEVVPKIHG